MPALMDHDGSMDFQNRDDDDDDDEDSPLRRLMQQYAAQSWFPVDHRLQRDTQKH